VFSLETVQPPPPEIQPAEGGEVGAIQSGWRLAMQEIIE